jgi:hypothetical protein
MSTLKDASDCTTLYHELHLVSVLYHPSHQILMSEFPSSWKDAFHAFAPRHKLSSSPIPHGSSSTAPFTPFSPFVACAKPFGAAVTV